MNTQVSTPVKIFAVVALVAGVLLMGGMMFLGPSADDSAADTFVPPVKATQKSSLTPELEPTAKKTKPAATKASGAKAAATKAPAAEPKTPAKPKVQAPRPLVAENGLPMMIADALRNRPIAVVALVDRGAQIDTLALDEAAAGARDAGAAFVALDVARDTKAAEALMLKFNVVLRSPSVYIFTRPGQVAVELTGYRDRQTVAQAAINALG